jgi:NAD(P)-dependent dehydrogenase (short-subunit alcohol dehydrogenase family)
MELNVKGKRVLVTGASSGLGEHFARLLASEGADVTLAARGLERVEDIARELQQDGCAAQAAELDVCDPESVASFFDGLRAFDVVVNNAGITGEGAALDMAVEDFKTVLDTNLTGAYQVAQAAARGMKDAGGGSIINIASILGLRVAKMVAAYTASKAGLVQLTKALALEWARYDIRVNALCPGYIETPINADFFKSEAGQSLIKRIPQRRLGQFEDLDGALMLLACDRSAYMTGSVIAIDGGHLVSGL